QYNRTPSTLMRAYGNMKHDKFKYYILKQRSDVFHALKHFFSEEKKEAVASKF
ncbi:sporulation protein YhbH, partial [Geobacillus stearothermophilus]